MPNNSSAPTAIQEVVIRWIDDQLRLQNYLLAPDGSISIELSIRNDIEVLDDAMLVYIISHYSAKKNTIVDIDTSCRPFKLKMLPPIK